MLRRRDPSSMKNPTKGEATKEEREKGFYFGFSAGLFKLVGVSDNQELGFRPSVTVTFTGRPLKVFGYSILARYTEISVINSLVNYYAVSPSVAGFFSLSGRAPSGFALRIGLGAMASFYIPFREIYFGPVRAPAVQVGPALDFITLFHRPGADGLFLRFQFACLFIEQLVGNFSAEVGYEF